MLGHIPVFSFWFWFMACIGVAGAAEFTDLSGDKREFDARAAKLFHREYFTHPWQETEHTIDGEDWSLPPWVRAAKNSGVMINPQLVGTEFPGRIERAISFDWRKLEPEEGRYDFSQARQRVLEASEGGRYTVKIGLAAAVWETRYFKSLRDATVVRVGPGSAPLWLRTHGVPLIEERPNSSNPFQVVNMDIYHPEYHQRYLRMVAEFGRSGVLQMPEVGICYLHLKSASRGEEGAGPPVGHPLRPRFEERLRAWAQAAGPAVCKLASVSSNESDLALSLALGMGQRNGFVEHYLLHAPNPELGQELDNEGYLVVNESHPLMDGRRASGDENEEYSNEVRFGPLATFPHRYHESMLRALQMRRNHLWAEGGRWLIDPPLLNYVALELARTVADAPDAWCYLRESYVPGRKLPGGRDGPQPVKNFERWIYQRDADGARTVPAERWDIPPQMFEFAKDKLYEFTARRTDVAAGQKEIRFAVAGSFLHGGPHPVAVKVTYVDRGPAQWELEVATPRGPARRRVTCGDTGKLRTATFIVPDAVFDAAGTTGTDLRIVAIRGDAVVRMVRIVKLAVTARSY